MGYYDSGPYVQKTEPQGYDPRRAERTALFLTQYLASNPQAAYAGAIPTGGGSRQNQYWGRNFGNVYNEYLGNVARGQPELQFTSFLENYPWLQKYYGMSPQQRGDYSGNLTPRAVWNY